MSTVNCLKKATAAPKKFAKFGKLPGRPSALIRLALADLRYVERHKKTFGVDMNSYAVKHSGKCHVCLGGAALAGTVGFDVDKMGLDESAGADYATLCDIDDTFGDAATAAYALDCFRTGELLEAFAMLDLEFPDHQVANTIYIVRYSDNPSLFKKQLGQLADQLESIGY